MFGVLCKKKVGRGGIPLSNKFKKGYIKQNQIGLFGAGLLMLFAYIQNVYRIP